METIQANGMKRHNIHMLEREEKVWIKYLLLGWMAHRYISGSACHSKSKGMDLPSIKIQSDHFPIALSFH